jgi:group I intron endonuclease
MEQTAFGGIYCFRNIINDKRYIGQHKGINFEKRWNQHKKKSNKCVAIRNAIQKYGIDSFDISIIELCYENQEALDKLEIHYIKDFNSLVPHGYNLQTGGSRGGIPCAATRKKMSDAKKGKAPHNKGKKGKSFSILTKLKMSLAKKGFVPYNKGIKLSLEAKLTRKPFTIETRRKMSEARKGIVLSEVTKKKISRALKGIVKSQETKIKMSLAKMGKKMRPFTEETKKKMSEARKGFVVSEETKKKLSELRKGLVLSEETRKKISLAKKGKKKGPLTEETKKKISEAQKGKTLSEAQVLNMSKTVYQYSLDNIFIKEWASGSDASRTLKISRGNITSVCKGDRNSAGGFIWRFTNNE